MSTFRRILISRDGVALIVSADLNNSLVCAHATTPISEAAPTPASTAYAQAASIAR